MAGGRHTSVLFLKIRLYILVTVSVEVKGKTDKGGERVYEAAGEKCQKQTATKTKAGC